MKRLRRRIRIRKAGYVSGAFCLAAGFPWISAYAQETGALPQLNVSGQQETALGPVKGFLARKSIAATKTDTPLMQTSQNVTVITRDRLEDLNIRSIAEAMRYTAGVTDAGGRDDPRGFGGTIRGFTPDTYLDGLKLPLASASQTFDLEPYGLERIDVLRGANAALYGSGQLGGIINAVSKQPRLDHTNEVQVQGGSFNRIQGAADLGGKLTDDGSWLWRLNGLMRKSDTFVDNVLNNRIYVAPSVKWSGEKTTVTFLSSYMQIDAGSAAQFLPAIGTVFPSRYGYIRQSLNTGDPNYDVYSKREVSVGYLAEHHVTDRWTLRQNLRFMHEDLNYRTVTTTGLVANQRSITRQAQQQLNMFNTLAVDNQSEVHFATGPVTHDLLTGVNITTQFISTRRGQGTGPSLDLYAPVYRSVTAPAYASTINTNETQIQTGVYVQDQLAWQHWRLTLTGREDFVSDSLTNNKTRSTQNSDPTHFSYRAGLLYAADNGMSPYVTYATSFQPQTGVDRVGNSYVPTTGNQVEVGIKYKPVHRDIMFTVDAFDLTQQNVLTPDPNNVNFSIQTGEIRTRGAEAEATGNLTPTLRMIAALTYQEPLITSSTEKGATGSRPVFVPSHMASLYMEKEFPVSERWNFALGSGVRYNGETSGAVPNTFNVPSSVQFDLTARVEMDRWRLQVNATNLADRRIVAGCVRMTSCYYATGRAVFATLGYRW
ncbi:TonB-dependent siderophore receptor [Granulibacter bethesdensis]|uniref:TonB-dependent siderophore receptor n=1 Tax=Granulibacter bethesdensis TaxID=364410 RepID=UPI0003F1D7D9|nr:TonB-dependent siderophore receptor [Granulibacter bethesdensis]AHJ65596.1 Outer membrane siderophore receptor [Granulibacter bethesdensis CGDNIH4]